MMKKLTTREIDALVATVVFGMAVCPNCGSICHSAEGFSTKCADAMGTRGDAPDAAPNPDPDPKWECGGPVFPFTQKHDMFVDTCKKLAERGTSAAFWKMLSESTTEQLRARMKIPEGSILLYPDVVTFCRPDTVAVCALIACGWKPEGGFANILRPPGWRDN